MSKRSANGGLPPDSDESAKSESTHRHSTLAAAYVAALAEAGAVGKDKTNAHHDYDYASAEAIIAAAREPLAAHGLGLLPTEFAIEANEKGEPAGIKREFVLVHESGEKQILSIAWPVVIERGRPADKAVAIADTASLKFLLRGLLLLPRVDATEEMDARRDSAPAARLSSGASGASAGNGHSGEASDARDDEPETPAPEIRAVGEWPGLRDALTTDQFEAMQAKFPQGISSELADAAIAKANRMKAESTQSTQSATPKADGQRLPA